MSASLEHERNKRRAEEAQRESLKTVNGVEVLQGDYFDIEETKRRLERKSFEFAEKSLDEGSKAAVSLAKMILEGKHYPKTKVSISAKLESMQRGELLGHMKKMLGDGSA
jgi:hypothetical protein